MHPVIYAALWVGIVAGSFFFFGNASHHSRKPVCSQFGAEFTIEADKIVYTIHSVILCDNGKITMKGSRK